tara:strand:- start:613 stop:1872 length:1260 start_codon:yes stop_codon:yes gene_type:complete
MYKMSALPNAVNYAESLPSLPAGATAREVVLRPTNGSTFQPNSTISWDFNNAGFIDPASVYIRYKYTIASTGASSMIGTPYATPFSRLSLMFASQMVENISQYNQVVNALSNCTLDVAQKYGLQSLYGFKGESGVPTLEELDGRTCAINEVGTFGGHLPCLLTQSQKLFPAFASPQIRLELAVDSVANMFRPDSTAVPTGITLSNVELVYRQIDLGAEVEAMVRSMGDMMIRSSSFVNSASVLSAGTQGQVSLVFNQRLASIKSAFLLCSSNQADSNLWGDAVDVTKSNGTYAMTVAGTVYPQTPYSTSQNKNGILAGLKQACGSIYDKTNAQSINSIEWNLEDGDATTLTAPGKFYVGVDLEVVDSDFILSGISSQNSSISVDIQLGTATTDSHNVNLLMAYDAIIEINSDGQANVRM